MQKNINRRLLSAFFAAALSLTIVLPAAAAERELVPLGRTVGIQMSTDGVVVVGLSEMDDGSQSPAGAAGLRPGDVVLSVGGRSTATAADFMTAVGELDGEPVELEYRRDGSDQRLTLSPKMGKNGAWQLGLWLRDSVSGIGTVTFYDPETGVYGALGHSISDSETGIIMPLGEGAIMLSTVVDVKAGVSGVPGELCGYFDVAHKMGDISINTPAGIYGHLDDYEHLKTVPVAGESEIELGRAVILSNVRDDLVEEFDVEITRIYRQGGGRSMMISVTDPELLRLTGGIVQGMSGSPVLQNGKLIGAVTHVLVDDPTRGYGISIEEMLQMADSIGTLSIAS